MCYWNKKKQGWTEAIALKDTKVFGQKVLNANQKLNQKNYIEQKFTRWIELK